MSQPNQTAPTTWDAFDRGRASSFGSLESITEDQQQGDYGTTPSFAVRVPTNSLPQTQDGEVPRRRSSFAMRFNSIRQMGGPNSIDNFVSSYQRAASFHQISPVRRTSVSNKAPDDDEEAAEAAPKPARPQLKSLLSQQMDGAAPQTLEAARKDSSHIHSPPTETTSLLPPAPGHNFASVRSRLGPDVSASLAASYSSISPNLSESARRRASILIDQRIEASIRARDQPDEYRDDDDAAPLQRVESETTPDGQVIERIVGESTVPMTIFNSTNVLVGVGILALPLAVRYSGWIIGMLMLILAALVTAYTAKLLAKCLDTNIASTTYGDIAFLAFDNWGRGLVEFLFILELTAANVALIILFADSMSSLIPQVNIIYWKIIIAVGLLPLNFVPFKTLSVTSVLGIACMLGIVVIVFTDGLLKPHSPGSLREFAKTNAFPADIRTIPLSLGLFMAPWGGHSVFPAIYKDMRHPKKYGQAVRSTYIFTYGLDVAMAVLGYLMFGDQVRDEVTANILNSSSYPRTLSFIIVILIAIVPITKIPLANRPVMDTVNKKFLIDLRQMDAKARMYSEKAWSHRLARASIGILVNLVQLGISIGVPDFDSIMALMGSALCFTICVTLPVSFYLKIFWGSDEISRFEKMFCFCLVIICIGLGLLGTVFACLPKDKIGAQACAKLLGC